MVMNKSCQFFPMLICRFSTNPVKIQKVFFCEICQDNSKITMEEQRAWIPKTILKNNEEWFVLPNVRIYYKVIFIKDKVVSMQE